MYDDHYGLSGRPFQLTPDPKFWFDTATHRKAMAYLGYGLSQGEGFVVIARRYRVAPIRLARANGLRLTSVISPGQKLRVPGRVSVARAPRVKPRRMAIFHTVRPGEGFFVIADRYRVRATTLASANGLGLASVLTPGQRLRVPGRFVAAAKPPVQRPAASAGARHDVAEGESFFSIAYDAKEAMTGPAPGGMPRIDPRMVPRTVEAIARVISPGRGRRWSMRVDVWIRPLGDASVAMISANPNIPIASGMKPMPSTSPGTPIVNLVCPVVGC